MADASAAAAPAGAAPPAAPSPKLDELMLAMDVVDTIRHQDRLVETELGQDQRDAALKQRLREIYESQGLQVTDRILDEGIRALKESRFAYTPPARGMGTFLAGLWINRGRVGKIVAAVAVLLAVFVGWQVWRHNAEAARTEAARVEIAETLPRELQAAAQAALDAAAVPEARAEAERLSGEGSAALARGDAAGARQAIADLAALRQKLLLVYELRIVSRPNADTGVWRIPDVNEGARNYYLIVEAVTPDGKVLEMPILSEEDDSTRTVTMWGVRVPESTFEAVREDKAEDGIVQDDALGEKRRGALEVTWLMPVEGGFITQW